jgi:membrane-bound ClpP family serine protease
LKGVNEMGFFGMIASMLLGIFFIAFGISCRKHKGCSIILIALGIIFVLFSIYLGFPK